jgi:tight adherence protein C
MSLELLRSAVLVTLAAAACGWFAFLAGVSVPPPPALGRRGAARKAALAKNTLFRGLEPALRFLSGLVALFPHARLVRRQELELKRADYPLGLTTEEYGALALLSAALLGGTAFALATWTSTTPGIAVMSFVFGLGLPKLQVEELVRKRVKEVTRGLPHAIEIIALCMGAGCDFPGALRLLVGSGVSDDGPLNRELALLLESLELGHTRREALLALAERVPSAGVRDFVNAVVQAEEKGNPLARVIQIQGRLLNQRRSVAAEEAAARAGVLMIAPLMLLLCAILLVLMGPFIVGGAGF